MRKIYVLDENNNLKEIDAGVTSYNELTDVPISLSTINTKVEIVDGNLTIKQEDGHR
jgi:hypothetical protein